MTAEVKDVILYFVYHSPKPLTKTSLMKFVYLADYQHYRLYGEQLTDSVWQVDQFGPVDYAILDIARILDKSGKLQIVEGRTGYGDPMTQFVACSDLEPLIELGGRTAVILSELLRMYGRWTARKLADMCKLTEPFLVEPTIGDWLDMDTIKRTVTLEDYPEVQRLKSRLASMDLSERGDPEEWAHNITEVYRSTGEARKRATTAGLEGRADS